MRETFSAALLLPGLEFWKYFARRLRGVGAACGFLEFGARRGALAMRLSEEHGGQRAP